VSDIEVRAVDVDDEAQLRTWWETGRAAHVDRPYDFYPVWEFSRVALPADRRRLGLALKVANLQLLQGLPPDARRVTTYNGEVNSHMIGVNERLGFRPVERLGEFQKRL